MYPESEEPDTKMSQLKSPLSPIMSPSAKTVDVSILHSENQKLVQESEAKKKEIRDLEAQIEQLKREQSLYDSELVLINRTWNQLSDDLILLGLRCGGGLEDLNKLDHADYFGGSVPQCSPEEMFLCRLLGVESINFNGNKSIDTVVEESLACRQSETLKSMTSLKCNLDLYGQNIICMCESLGKLSSTEDALINGSKVHDMMKAEAEKLNQAIDLLRLKHAQFNDDIQNYNSCYAADECEIKRLEGDQEEIMIELEEARRKLINLRMQKEEATKLHGRNVSTENGYNSPESETDRIKEVQELEDAIKEARLLADDRLSELQEFREENNVLSRELENTQNEMKDDKHVLSSRLYNLVNDQLQHLTAEAERYKASLESFQLEKPAILRREKEISMRLECADSSKNACKNTGSKIEELEMQLRNLISEKNDLEIKLEEALQDSGKRDIQAEFQVMASALTKELSMMEAQVNRWKETAEEANSLRQLQQSLEASLQKKNDEERILAAKCAEQDEQINHLKEMIDKAGKELLEKQLIVDMHVQDNNENRDIEESKASERRARQQAEQLKELLAGNSLELRVKVANEAKAAYQQRLSSAENEISKLTSAVNESERGVLEVKEAIKNKERETEIYISEIETIGQAYEDMQTQNHNLLQQVAEGENFYIKLVAESMKMKQTQKSLLLEKQALEKQVEQYDSSIEGVKASVSPYEEQMRERVIEALKATEEVMELNMAGESAKWELMDVEKEVKWVKHVVASYEKEDEQIQKKIEETCKQVGLERLERERLSAQVNHLKLSEESLKAETGEAAIMRLHDQITDCKSIIKCTVCSDRPKEVVIVKCYHLFCNPCIQRNLEIRHRKCPACGTTFGQNDVKSVKI